MPFVAAYGGQWTVNSLGINETLFVKRENDLMSAQLGTKWELAPDFSSATISVRAGVPWWSPVGLNKDFGEFSAEDAVWFLNRANATTNPESSYKFAGTLAGAVSRAELIDRTTFKLYPSQGTKFSVITLQDILSEWAHGSEMFSQRVFDEMGIEWAARNPVGTGPMRLVEWVVNDHGTVEATPSHYLHPSRHVFRLTQVQVPENASRVAMLKTGEVDAISVPIVFVGELEREGFKFLNPMDQLIPIHSDDTIKW